MTVLLADQHAPAWRDGKRYAWLLGVLVPDAPVHRVRVGRTSPGLGFFWFWGPILIFGVFPPLDLLIGLDSENPPDSVSAGSSRTATTAGARTRSCRFSTPGSCSRAGCGRAATCDRGQGRPRADRGDGERDRDQHRARARPQARPSRALAEQDRARPERLRPLLRRAQPRSSRARGHARGSGERAARRELLGVPAADGVREPRVGVGARTGVARARRALVVEHGATTCSTRGR